MEVGELIGVLSGIAKWEAVQLLVWWISILAIATSVLGVGVGLCDAINKMLARKALVPAVQAPLACILTILPAYLVVIYVPNAFVAALGFAGMILAIIAILLPIYLFFRMKREKLFYRELKATWLLVLSLAVGLAVIVCELYNMLSI